MAPLASPPGSATAIISKRIVYKMIITIHGADTRGCSANLDIVTSLLLCCFQHLITKLNIKQIKNII